MFPQFIKNSLESVSNLVFTQALNPENEMENENLVLRSKNTGADFFLDYVKNGGKELIREKRHVTRAVRPTKR